VFVSSPLEGALYNARFYNRAKFFEQVHANTDAGGNDRAYVYDASGNEVFQASASGASLRGDHAATWLYGFEYVRASATRGGTDKAEVSAVDYILKLEGRWD
jgi:YD repeat-containing protein